MAFTIRQIRIGVQRRLFQQKRLVSEVKFTIPPFKLHKIKNGPSTTVTLKKDEALQIYDNMKMIREMEDAGMKLYKEKKIHGFCHLYSGQEASAVGFNSAMDVDDAATTSYRCHGWAYLLGATVTEILAEMTGKVSGIANGKGGSMHMHTKRFFGGNAIVGSQTSLGTGVAFSFKYRNMKNVAVTCFSDGSANQGQLYESMNMAQLWKLPVVYVCENNGWAMTTKSNKSAAQPDYYTRGDYIPGIRVDARDVLATREALRWAKEHCNAGRGPVLLESVMFRFYGHSMGHPSLEPFTPEELEGIRRDHDPILLFKKRIIDAKLVNEAEIAAIDANVRKVVDKAVVAATTDKELPEEAVYADVYHNTAPFRMQGLTSRDYIVPKYTTTREIIKSQK
ncbi:unnamed protein product [Caenorhabditis auriculariae]|uniref:pyruvate dehydrogenase (acetyl-transferring) n=1 Tax=Caenorhabditis auriculariae TaxID=2777116 RepID=A0A8S1HLZ0_9PELO|nr:unnamed protein product [Caenorhabditis auriculariae]